MIKAIRIYRQLFPEYRKPPQKIPVIIPFSVLYFQLIQKISVLFSCLPGKSLQVCLDPFADIFPFFAHQGIEFLIRLLVDPVFVIIHIELFFQLQQFFFLQELFFQNLVDPLRIQRLLFLFQKTVGLPPEKTSGISD